MNQKPKTIEVGDVPSFVNKSATAPSLESSNDNRLQNAVAIAGATIAVFYLGRSYYYEHFYKRAHNQVLKPEPASRRVFVVNSSERFMEELNTVTGTFSGVADFVSTTLTLYTDTEATGVQRLKKDLLSAFDMLEKRPCMMEASYVQINGEDPDIFMSPEDLVRVSANAKMTIRHVIVFTVDGTNIKVFDVKRVGKVMAIVPDYTDPLTGNTATLPLNDIMDVFIPTAETYAPSLAAVEHGSGLDFTAALKSTSGFSSSEWPGLPATHHGALHFLAPSSETIRRLAMHLRYAHQVEPQSKFLQLVPPSVLKFFKMDSQLTVNSHVTAPFEVVIGCSVRSKSQYKKLLEVAKTLKMKTNVSDDHIGYPAHLFLNFQTSAMPIHICHEAAFDAARVLVVNGIDVERIRVKAVLGDVEVDHNRPFFIHREEVSHPNGNVSKSFRGLVPVQDEHMLNVGIVGQMQFFEFTIRASIADENLEDICSLLSGYDAYVSRNKFGSVAQSTDDISALPKKERVHLIVFRSCGIGWHSASARFERLRAACEADERIVTSDVQSAFIVYDSDLVADKGMFPVEDGSEEGDVPLEMAVSFFPESVGGKEKRTSF